MTAMGTNRISPDRLRAVITEAQRVANRLSNSDVDPNEVAKAVQFFTYYGFDTELFQRYLSTMADNPPPRSRRTKRYYETIKQVWRSSGVNLRPEEKAYAWSWAVRLMRAAHW